MKTIELDHLPAQDEYFNAPELEVAFVGGLGTGKTMVASDDVLNTAMLYPKCGTREKPGIGIFSNTYAQLTQGTMGTFFERCDHWGVSYIDKIRGEHKVFLKDFDCWIAVWSVDEPLNFKSLELCHIWIDEAQAWDEFAYNMILGRRRGTQRQRKLYPQMPLKMRITANPPHTMDHWLVDRCTKIPPGKEQPQVRLITAATRDNPFLPDVYIESLEANYDPDLAAIELGGQFGDIGRGKIWRRFNRNSHVLGDEEVRRRGLPPLIYDRTLPLCWSHDFNIDPLCSILFQWRRVDAKGYQRDVMYVIDEIKIPESVISMAVEEFVYNRPEAVEVARRSDIYLYGDATGNSGNRQTGESDWSALRAALVKHSFRGENRVASGNPYRVDRWAAGNAKLENANHDVGVVIHPRCKGLIEDLSRMLYKPGTRLVEVPKIKDGLPVKAITHLADAWSYPIFYEYPVKESPQGATSTQR